MRLPRTLSLGSVKRRLVDGTLSSTSVFVYFVVIIAIDNLQLALLQLVPAKPTFWTPFSVYGSLALGALFLVGTFYLNGGSRGRDYLQRYFSLSAVSALWIAIPFQLTITVARSTGFGDREGWFIPVFVFCTNVAFFSFVACQIHDVATRAGEASEGS